MSAIKAVPRAAEHHTNPSLAHCLHTHPPPPSCVVVQMDQKHAIEDVLLDAGLPGLMLEATMFMEEFWKRYTRPGLLKGTFTFSLPGDRPLQLVAARDMGLAAANALSSRDPGSWAGQRLPLAGDELTPLQMCEAFSKAQGGMAVKHSSPPAWIFWFLSRWGPFGGGGAGRIYMFQ